MSGLDATIRIALVIAIAALYFTGTVSGTLAIVLGVAAGIFLLTSVFSICPLYSVLGISTCSIEKK